MHKFVDKNLKKVIDIAVLVYYNKSVNKKQRGCYALLSKALNAAPCKRVPAAGSEAWRAKTAAVAFVPVCIGGKIMKVKLSKKVLSLALAALMVVTSVPIVAFNALAFTTKNVTDLFHYEFNNGSVSDSLGVEGDLANNNWGTVSSGSDYWADTDGALSGSLTSLSGKSAWGLSYNFTVNTSVSAAGIISLGSQTANSQGDTGNATVMYITQAGELSIDGSVVNSSACSISTGVNYTIVLEYDNGTFTVTLNDSQIYSGAVNTSNFTNVTSFYLGLVGTSDNSTINNWSGTKDWFVYDFAGYTFSNDEAYVGDYEVTGYVDIDPVIYVHGTYNGSADSDYSYMMKGDIIADATVNGEKYTNVSVSSEKTVDKIYVSDTGAQITISDGKLTGQMGGGYGFIDLTTTDSTATLIFSFTDGSYETHKLAVRANPVAGHTLVASFNYNNNVTNQKRREVNFEVMAVDSYGTSSGGSLKFSSESDLQKSASGNANFAYMFAPYDTSRGVTESSYVLTIPGMTSDAVAADKVVGYYGTASWKKNGDRTAYVTSNAINYYLDISSDKNEGVTYDSSTGAYSIKLFVSNLYDDKKNTGGALDTHTVTTSSGNMYIRSTDSTISVMDSVEEHSGYITLGGTANAGTNVNATHTLQYSPPVGGSTYARASIATNILITVSDKSSLRTVYDSYAAENLDSRCYTDESWQTYKNALLAAEIYLCNYSEYNTTTQSNLLASLQSAKSSLELSTDRSAHSCTAVVTQPTCTSDGYTTYTCDRGCGYTEVADNVSATGHTYVYTPVDGTTTHTVTCAQGDVTAYVEACVDADDDGNCDLCSQTLLADWTEYNTNLAALETAMSGDSVNNAYCSVSALNSIASELADYTYYNMTTDERADVRAADQDAVTAEAQSIAALIPTLIQTDAALSATFNDDPDQYDADAIDTLKANITATVTIDGVDYTGVNYESQSELDSALAAALNTAMTYDITLNGEVIETDVPYGTAVIVVGDTKEVKQNVTDISENYGAVTYDWSYSYKAPSNSTGSIMKYVTTATCIGFVVKGDTELEAVSASETVDEYKITYVYGSKIIDVQYTENQTFTVKSAPALAYYTFDGYSDGYTAGQEVTTNKNITITANYSSTLPSLYYINVYDSPEDCLFGGDPNYHGRDSYNKEIICETTLSDSEFYCWAKQGDDIEFTYLNDWDIEETATAYTFEIISFEKNYSFYTCETVAVVAISKEQAQAFYDAGDRGYVLDTDGEYEDETPAFLFLDGQRVNPNNQQVTISALEKLAPVYDANGEQIKVTLIGSVGVPDGYEVIETGFLVAKSTSAKADEDFTIYSGNVSRLKAGSTTGEQFVLNITTATLNATELDYRAYAIYEDSDGRHVIYSNTSSGDPVYRNVSISGS